MLFFFNIALAMFKIIVLQDLYALDKTNVAMSLYQIMNKDNTGIE